jgi:uncharacterized membrane-anchored protein
MSLPLRTLLAGAVCLAILSGMIVLHAWPLWTGQTAVLPVTPVDPRDLFRGEFVRLDTPATILVLSTDVGARPENSVVVTPVGDWWSPIRSEYHARFYAAKVKTVYVQLQRREGTGEHHPVTVSDEPIAGALNLRGRVRWIDAATLHVDYGLDAYYMQEGTAKPVEDALRNRRKVQMEIAVANSGRARIRRLLVDGVPTR